MKLKVRITLYALLIACAVFFGYRFYLTYTGRHRPAPPAQSSTNLPAAGPSETIRQASPRLAELASYAAVLFGVVVGLSLLIARDVSHFTATKVEAFLWDDEGEGMRNPEYEQAEETWQKGQHLEAIQLMRDYYKRNPREVYVALRIAEIYEKDLNNPLAAALEYEEVLKRKLPMDRWGWAAIHLSNLYTGKLNKPQQALVLLQRIVAECGEVPSAKKARERLEALQAEHPEVGALPPPPAPPDPPPPPPGPKLPPGFRPLGS